MYDTIGISCRVQDAMKVLQYLDFKENPRVDENTGEILVEKGILKNMYIKVTSNHISITGSLAKYYFGNNFQELTILDTQRAIEMLSDALRLNLREANIYRLDFGWNFQMNNIISEYIPFLLKVNRLTTINSYRGNNNYGKSFSTKKLKSKLIRKKIYFYDKIAEALAHKETIPEFAKNKCFFRYEVGFGSRNVISTMFKQEVLVKDLYSKEVFAKCVDVLENHYLMVEKAPTLVIINPEIKDIYNDAQIKNVALFEKILRDFGSIENYYSFLNREERKGNITKQTKSNKKKNILKFANYPAFHIDTHAPIKELDQKVIQRANEIRRSI